MSSEPTGSLRLTLTLIATWAVATVGLIAVITATKLTFPEFLAKAGPFILAGVVTGWLVPVTTRRPKIIAAATLVVVSALAWTGFGVITHDAPMNKALVLFGAGLPVMIVASLWAYFGMYLGGRRHGQPTATKSNGGAELDDLEQELRNEITSEPAK